MKSRKQLWMHIRNTGVKKTYNNIDTIKVCVMACYVALGIILVILILSIAMWIRGVGKLRKTEEYKNF